MFERALFGPRRAVGPAIAAQGRAYASALGPRALPEEPATLDPARNPSILYRDQRQIAAAINATDYRRNPETRRKLAERVSAGEAWKDSDAVAGPGDISRVTSRDIPRVTPGDHVRGAASDVAKATRSALSEVESAGGLAARSAFAAGALGVGWMNPGLRSIAAAAAFDPPPEVEGFGQTAGAKLRDTAPGAIASAGALAGHVADELATTGLTGLAGRAVLGQDAHAETIRRRDAGRGAAVAAVGALPGAVAAVPSQLAEWVALSGGDYARYRALAAAARADGVLSPAEYRAIVDASQAVSERGLEAAATAVEGVGLAAGGISAARFIAAQAARRAARRRPRYAFGAGDGVAPGAIAHPPRRTPALDIEEVPSGVPDDPRIHRVLRDTPTDREIERIMKAAHDPETGYFFSREQMDRIFKRFIESGAMKQNDTITTYSVVPPGQKGVAMANQVHPKTKVHFDERGLPIFGPHAKAAVQFTRDEWRSLSYRQMMREASRRLADDVEKGRSTIKLQPEQLADLKAGRETIGGFTWHHDLATGQMQLVPRDKHAGTGHVGHQLGKGMVWIMK
ncbi:MAG: HNH endonuclease [Pseudomonadota bacterium]